MFALVDDNDSIVLVNEPRIPVTLKSALAGLALLFGYGWMPK